MLTLHLYDHCPFCTRVELALAHHGVSYNRTLYHYGEGSDMWNPEGGPIPLMGKKVLPVLELEDGSKIGESLDIVAYLGKTYGNSQLLKGLTVTDADGYTGASFSSDNNELSDWEKRFGKVKSPLTRPRITQMTHLTDWADERDIAYARRKYERMGFSYDDAERDFVKLSGEMNELLVELDVIVAKFSSEFAMDDCTLLPNLRTLGVVKGIVWPEKLKSYVTSSFEGCKKNGCDLYFDHAC